MQPHGQERTNTEIDKRYRVILVIWFAILTAVGMFFVMTQFVPRPPAESSNEVMAWTLAGAGLAIAFLSVLVKQMLLAKAVEKQQLQIVQQAYTVAFALSEVASLFGVLMYFITNTPYYFLMFIVSVIFMVVHFPRRRHLVEASYRK